MRAVLLLLALGAAPAAADELDDQVGALMARELPALGHARVGIAAVDVRTGKVLLRRGADQSFNLASNAKLVTAAAALATLGPEYRWKTVVLADRWDGGDTVAGNLYVRGGADPSLDAAALWQLARELRTAGITHVSGSLVIDDGFFDGALVPPAFDQKPEDASFRAPVSAASLDYNAVTVHVHPGASAGTPARVVVTPASDAVIVKNEAVTSNEGETSIDAHAHLAPGGGATEIVVTGSIRAVDHDGVEMRKRVDLPPLFLGSAFRVILTEVGVQVAGGVKIATVPPAARVLARRESEPLSWLVRELEKFSNNFMAETVLKTMGAERARPGTWAGGVATVRDWLAGIGVAPGSYRYDNGSGLYDSNRFTPDQIVTVLRAAAVDFRISSDYISALPVAGADGTLAHRMVGGPGERYVRAKTGTIDGVSTLSGYAGGDLHPTIAFSVLVNDLGNKAEALRAARALEDGVAELLIKYLEGQPY